MEHVKAGLKALADDPTALLVFSGYALVELHWSARDIYISTDLY